MADRKTSPFRKSTKDSDGDGLSDAAERRIGTDPDDWDSDGDGLSDFAEAKLRLDPNDRDSDGDGWEDGYEVGVGTNPKSAYGKDGRGAYTEKQQRDLQKKPAYKDDRDRDRLLDRHEGPGGVGYGTDPRHGDSDGDGIGDGIEVMRGTSPVDRDSDGNERSDLEQLELGRRPTEPGARDAPIDWREKGRFVGDAGAPATDERDVVAFDGEDRAVAALEPDPGGDDALEVESLEIEDMAEVGVVTEVVTEVELEEPVVAFADDGGLEAGFDEAPLDETGFDDGGFDATAEA